MRLNTRGKIVIGLIYTILFVAAEVCLMQVIFRRDNPFWILYFIAGYGIVFLICAIHDRIQAHIETKKGMYESAFERR